MAAVRSVISNQVTGRQAASAFEKMDTTWEEPSRDQGFWKDREQRVGLYDLTSNIQ